MDFIERIFGLSPDHGSGVTEIAVLLALTASLSLVVGMWRRRRARAAAAPSRR
jgi:hypothetical protein